MSGDPGPSEAAVHALEGPELASIGSALAEALCAEAQPLRDVVLSGRFIGANRQDNAARLGAFIGIDGASSLGDWFGPERVRVFAAAPHGLRGALDRDIAAIDALIASQLDAVLHHPRLRRLEGSWRGVLWLVDGIEARARIKVRLLNIAWPELCRDLERAAEFDQSNLFRRIYEDEFGTPGGEPFGLLVVDHEVRHRPAAGAPTDDVTALASLASVAAAAFAPIVLAASPSLLEVDAFEDLAVTADPATPFRGPDHARWRTLAGREDMRFIAVTLPRVLARPPWLDDPARIDGFRYAEYAPDSACRVWMTAGYAFASTVVRAFANHGWPADVRGMETDQRSGGLVDEMPGEAFSIEPRAVWPRASLDMVLTDRQERSLVDAGLMPLSALPFGEQAVFASVRSLQTPKQFIGSTAAAATANARLSAQLNSMLCVSRFAHYLKMLGREMVGSFKREDEIERSLQDWLGAYVNTSTVAGWEARSRFPLLSARVTVKERPGRPGVFGCIIHLQPHFQLDDVSATFRLVTDIVAPGART